MNLNSDEYQNTFLGQPGVEGSGLPVGEASSEEFCEVPKKSGRRLNSTVVIFIVLGLGAAGTYFYGLRHRPQETSQEEKLLEAKLDVALAKLTGQSKAEVGKALLNNTDLIVETFYNYPGKNQIDAEQLQGNPFAMSLRAESLAESENEAETAEEVAAQKKSYLVQELRNQVSELKLESVLMSPSGSKCLVNGEVFGKGQKIQETFTVVDIQTEEVTLMANSFAFILRM